MSFLPRPDRISLAALLMIAAFAGHARAQAPSAPAPETSVAIPMPTIPAPQPTALAGPEPGTVTELDELLGKIAGSDDAGRRAAMADLADSDPTLLPAISAKLATLRKAADRDAMGKLLDKSKRKGKGDDDDGSRHKEARGQDAGAAAPSACNHLLAEDGDWLSGVLSTGDRDKPGYKDLIAVLALDRACVCIGTTAAAREVIAVYTYFGDLLRPDVQRQLERMGERAVPALIEAKYHDSRMVRTWAEKRLDVLGKVIPGEAVRTADNQVLADILRAYGRAREVEAVRVIVTYANSDRLQVREAAREAIGQIGEPAKWQLKEGYENLTGRKAEPGWDWKRTAIELFAEYDRARLSEVYRMAEDGFGLVKAGKLQDGIKAFDRVLARAPAFARKAEMAPAYLEHARALRDSDSVAARAALRRAELLDPNGPNAKAVQSELALLEAEDLASHGVIDIVLLKRAVDLDPSNARAQAALQRAQMDAESRQASWRRYAAAIAIGVLALAAMLFVVLTPRRKRTAQTSGPAPEPPVRQPADAPPPAFPDPPKRNDG